MKRATATWWIVANIDRQGNGWHWSGFFDGDHDAFRWGGPKWIKSPQSYLRIERMRRGDFVIAYQGGEGIVGITRLSSRGYKARGSDEYDMFDLNPQTALRLIIPVPLAAVKLLPDAAVTFEFVRSVRGTVHRVEAGGFEQVLALGMAYNPSLAWKLWRLHPAA